FMFEMIGDFDVGRDEWGGEQKRVALEVVARVQRKFDLGPGTLRFHNQMGPKTCPGSQIDYDATVEEVRALHEAAPAAPMPRPQVVREPLPFPGIILETQQPFESAVRGAMDSLLGTGARAFRAPAPDPA